MSSKPAFNRRLFLAAAIAAPVALFAAPAFANQVRQRPAGKRDWRAIILDRDRYLEMERPQSGEKSTFCYYRKGKGWDARGYRTACSLLRDVESKKTVQMSRKLIDLLFIIQAWLRLNKLPYRIVINSGYRTPEFNAKLEGAAKNSMHIQAKAADIRIPGISTEQIAKLAKAIGVGGVGIYPSKGFIHIDIGTVRSWRVGALEQQPTWLAEFSVEEIDQALCRADAPDLGQIVYA